MRSPVPRLSLMMFLQYAVWGVWLPYLANYLMATTAEGGLGFTGAQVGWILGLAGSIGAISAPFLAGQVADRFMNAERWLGLLLITGGVVKFATAYAESYGLFMVLSIAYSIAYMPTLALTNSVAFAHLRDAEKQFPRVRTWGTIGWIVASSAFPLIWLQQDLSFTWLPPFLEGTPKEGSTGLIVDCLKVSGAVSVAYGLWSMLALPATPPKKEATSLAFADAFGMLKHRGFLVVTLAALPISMIHQVYFIRTGPFLSSIGYEDAHIGPVMSIGQFSEIAVLAVLGFFLKSLGYRAVLAAGCLGFLGRFGLFWWASGMPEEALANARWITGAAMILHGLCYGFFFAGAYVYIERLARPDIRHSVQTVFGIIILGLGPVLAGVYNQWLDTLGPETHDGAHYPSIWMVQALLGGISFLLVASAFRTGFPAPLDEDHATMTAEETPARP